MADKRSNEELLNELKTFYNTNGRNPRSKDLKSRKLYDTRFGSLSKALIAAGLSFEKKIKKCYPCGHCDKSVYKFPYELRTKSGLIFCSRSCSASHTNILTKKKHPPRTIITKEIKIPLNERLFEDIGKGAKRNRIIIEQNHCCNNCNVSEWQGQSITLEMEHKNGNNKDDRRENLECLCPNCHSLTSTWRGRNKKNQIEVKENKPYVEHNGNISCCGYCGDNILSKIKLSRIKKTKNGLLFCSLSCSSIYKGMIKESRDLLSINWNDLGIDGKRLRVILEQNGQCIKCKLDTWIEQPLILELEHKDGNHLNNDRDNVECLCPNCHSTTSTWRGKNQNRPPMTISDDEMSEALKNNKNIRQALIAVGMSPRGGNYVRAKRLLASFIKQ